MNLLDFFGLFQDTRGVEINPPQYSSQTLYIPTSDIDASPIKTKAQALETYQGWIYAAVSQLAETVAANEFTLWNKVRPQRKEWKEIERHALLDILANPNSINDWQQIAYISTLHLKTAGEFYWHVITKEGSTKPVGFQIIYPHWVNSPKFDKDGFFIGWDITVPGQLRKFYSRDEIIRIYYPHPLNPFAAASPIEAFAVSHYMDQYLRAYGQTLFRNDGGVPAGVIKTEQELTKAEADSLTERWKQRYSNTRGEVAAFGKGASYEPIAIPFQDLYFLEVGDFTSEQILAVYKTPKAVLGISKEFNRANIDTAFRIWQRTAVYPVLQMLEKAINGKKIKGALVSPLENERLYLEFHNPVDRDKEEERAEANDALKNGAMKVNEYRDVLDLDPQPDGDVYLVPNNVRILSSLTPELVAENRQLKLELAEKKHYSNLRGFFASQQVSARDSGYKQVRIDIEKLKSFGVEPDYRLLPIMGEEPVKYYERLKSDVAKHLARELAENEIRLSN